MPPRKTNEKEDSTLWNIHHYNIDTTSREVFLHGVHEDGMEGEEPGVEYRMATIFEKNINYLDRLSDAPILIHMHSCGGMWNDGMAIFDSIKTCKSAVTVLAYSHSRSMSSIIPQAADLRIIHEHADFMIHYGTMSVSDRVKVFLNEADQLKKANRIMMDIYVDAIRCGPHFKGWTDKKIENFLKKKMNDKEDWYMDAEEAVHYGFYDGILGSKEYPTIESIHNART
jgi:ATP-dependent protease ClpP protease subunit